MAKMETTDDYDFLLDYDYIKKPRSTCKIEIVPENGKDYVDVVFFSDLHIGSIFCDFNAVKRARDIIIDKNLHVLLGGDIIECATRFSIGAGVYQQNIPPTEQFLLLLDFFKPIHEKGLLLSAIKGNHEDRFFKDVGIDVMSIFSKHFNVPYLGTGGFNHLLIGNQGYVVYYTHGSGGSKFHHTKIKRVSDGSKYVDCDVYAQGHSHELAIWHELSRKYSKKDKQVKQVSKTLLLTGHYLKYDQSYADQFGMPPSAMGSPVLRFSSVENKIGEYTI
jgi:predicted phosphodiesterase